MSKAATSDEATQKERFKASVGASFSSVCINPISSFITRNNCTLTNRQKQTFISGSAKYGQESGKGTVTVTTVSNVSETLTFDDRGGNTIHAAEYVNIRRVTVVPSPNIFIIQALRAGALQSIISTTGELLGYACHRNRLSQVSCAHIQ